ncbi:MAG TPA: multicopper oxidase domain-containing protein [Candidatus Elarobacter sp.]
MGVRTQISFFVALAVVAATTPVSAVPVVAQSTAQPAMPAATTPSTALAAPCGPNLAVGGALPSPPTIDTAYRPSFELDVVGAPGGKLFCYLDPLDHKAYVDAPTIIVRAGHSFTMKLVDKIAPPIGPNPSPAPQAYAPDKCALLDYEHAALPPPSAPGYAGRQRVVATMSPDDMIANNTNFHTHGWHVEPDVDNVFKSVAQTANGVCTYLFRVRANQPPGSYWYHSHLHGLAEQQVGGGLAGTLIVLPVGAGPQLPDTVLLVKNYNGPAAGLEQQLDLQRRNAPAKRMVRATANRAQPPFDPFNPPAEPSGPKFPVPTPPDLTPCKTAPVKDSLAVNGVRIPVGPSDASLARNNAVPTLYQDPRGPGMVYRVVNAASDAYLNLRVIDANGAYQPMTVLGRDGVPVDWDLDHGRVDTSKADGVTRQNVFLGPSNRADIFIKPGFRGTIIGARAVAPFCLGYLSFTGLPSRGIVTIQTAKKPGGMLAAAAPAAATNAIRPRVSPNTPTFADVFAQSAPVTGQHRAITFTNYDDGQFYVTETGSMPQPLPTRWQEHPFWLRPAAAPPGPSPLPAESRYQADIWVKKLPPPQKTVEVWNIYNAVAEAHEFHIHQLTFVALVSAYEPAQSQRVFLDSIALPGAALASPPPGAPPPQPGYPYLKPSLTQIKIDFTNVDKGTFVFHCHMLFHEDHGMMGIVHLY